MANKIIKHCYNNCEVSAPEPPPEPDKSKSISELSRKELWEMLSRLRDESEVQRVIRELKRSSGERETLEEPFKIDTTTPINQLYHWGIKGQKWGVRRFQNADGTRTSAGKKRDKSRGRVDVEKTGRRQGKSEDHIASVKAKKKGAEGLSNEQLKKLNERLQLEETYKKLTKESLAKSESWVKESLAKSGKEAFGEITKGLMVGSAKLLIKQMTPQMYDAAFKKK